MSGPEVRVRLASDFTDFERALLRAGRSLRQAETLFEVHARVLARRWWRTWPKKATS